MIIINKAKTALNTSTNSTREFSKRTFFEETFHGIICRVIFAVGRTADTDLLNLDAVGVKVDPDTKKIIADAGERSSAQHVYAIGDVLHGKLSSCNPISI